MAVLPLKTQVRGPAPCMPPSDEEDIIDEALYYFKVFFFGFTRILPPLNPMIRRGIALIIKPVSTHEINFIYSRGEKWH